MPRSARSAARDSTADPSGVPDIASESSNSRWGDADADSADGTPPGSDSDGARPRGVWLLLDAVPVVFSQCRSPVGNARTVTHVRGLDSRRVASISTKRCAAFRASESSPPLGDSRAVTASSPPPSSSTSVYSALTTTTGNGLSTAVGCAAAAVSRRRRTRTDTVPSGSP